jgi:plastocyanin
MPVLAAALLVVGAMGCGAQRGERTSESSASGGGGAKTATTATTAGGTHQETTPIVRANRVVLSDRECVHFEPHWTTLRVGQSLTWHSDLKKPVTIHVPAGAFQRTEFVVRPGGTVTTGPCRSPGSYSVWTEPAACRDIPRGAQGPSPGLTVEGNP